MAVDLTIEAENNPARPLLHVPLRFKPNRCYVSMLGPDNNRAGQFVVPALLARIERDPEDAKAQGQHRNEVAQISANGLAGADGFSGARIHHMGGYNHFPRSGLLVEPEQDDGDKGQHPRNQEIRRPGDQGIGISKIAPAVDGEQKRKGNQKLDDAVDERSADARPEADVLEFLVLH